jgi:hypothetical protein
MSNRYLCIHGHFYQPPRTNPFTGDMPREPDAEPYANWNERVTAECYAPNATAGNFERISFNLGGTLASWLDAHAHKTYAHIVAAEWNYRKAHAISNGLAQPVHHTILPLARSRDKACQIHWGIASFAHRFGHQPEGMWLPEMAVDYETLEAMAAAGIRFTILSDEQVHGDLTTGAGPYRVQLPHGGEIAVFVRDRHLSNTLSFNMPNPSNIDTWLRRELGQRQGKEKLLLIATDGETFGHHHRQGVKILRHILEAEKTHGYTLTTLGLYLRDNPPQAELEIIENTAWSCSHNLGRWSVGCECTQGSSHWKGALRRALDNLACDLDGVYVQEAQRLGANPWLLRDAYIALVLGQMDDLAFLAEFGLGHLSGDDGLRILTLLEAQFHRQRMYASCGFFFEDLERLEPRYAIANGIRALALTFYATRDDLSHGFRRDLKVAVSQVTGRNGSEILDDILNKAAA